MRDGVAVGDKTLYEPKNVLERSQKSDELLSPTWQPAQLHPIRPPRNNRTRIIAIVARNSPARLSYAGAFVLIGKRVLKTRKGIQWLELSGLQPLLLRMKAWYALLFVDVQ